jgi:hypothetical protein
MTSAPALDLVAIVKAELQSVRQALEPDEEMLFFSVTEDPACGRRRIQAYLRGQGLLAEVVVDDEEVSQASTNKDLGLRLALYFLFRDKCRELARMTARVLERPEPEFGYVDVIDTETGDVLCRK